jgi:DNA-binding NarL/FixJ family response regulator
MDRLGGRRPAAAPSVVTRAEAPRRPVRVLVAIAENLFRDAVILLLKQASGIQIAGWAGDAGEVVRRASALLPDVVLLDDGMPRHIALEVTARLSKLSPRVRVLFLSSSHTDEAVVAAVRAGASGYVTKDVDGATLIGEIDRVASGELAVDRDGMRAMVAAATGNSAPRRPPEGLTARQFEILRRMARGMSLKQIGRELGVADKTIRNQASLMYSRLHVHDHVEAVLYALRKGIVA